MHQFHVLFWVEIGKVFRVGGGFGIVLGLRLNMGLNWDVAVRDGRVEMGVVRDWRGKSLSSDSVSELELKSP